jgi:hypothetical protein
MIGFDNPRGFAAVMLMGKQAVVARADGYPALDQVGPMMMAIALPVMMQARSMAESKPDEPSIEVKPLPAKKPAAKKHTGLRRSSTRRRAPRR